MMYLISQPEIAYLKNDDQVLESWTPPNGFFFKYSVHELKRDFSTDEVKELLVVSEKPVYLDKEEINHYKRKYR